MLLHIRAIVQCQVVIHISVVSCCTLIGQNLGKMISLFNMAWPAFVLGKGPVIFV